MMCRILRSHAFSAYNIHNAQVPQPGDSQAKLAFEAFQRAARFTPKDEKLYLLAAAAFLERQDYGHG
ncbi:MAG TPA: hypothetical protein VF749_22080, partial [Candidatus Acidoferrum sp.]